MKRVRLLVAVCVVSLALGGGLVALAALAPTLLPTGRSIDAPGGPVARVGTMPEGLALTRDSRRVLVLESGFAPAALRILDAATLSERGSVALKGAFGTPLVDLTGDGAWIAGANADQLIHVDLGTFAVDRTIALPEKCWATAVARVRAGLLAAGCEQTAQLVLVDEAGGSLRAAIPTGAHPSAVAASRDGAFVFVAAWGERGVDVVDVAAAKEIRRVGVGLHPEALALAPDGSHLYVANSDDDSISIVDLKNLDLVPPVERVAFDGTGAFGNNLNGFAVSADGRRLYVSAGAANAVYAFAIEAGGGLRRLGAIPTGWYPTAVLSTRDAVYVANGLGERSRANPEYSLVRGQYRTGYIPATAVGSIRKLPVLDDTSLRDGDARVVRLAGGAPAAVSDAVVRPNGPIKHVIYVIKENRTYDQVFGDIAEADGDRNLVLFGEQVTPNEHAIVRRFGVFDRTFCDAQVSADGHSWSTAAIANDYLEKMWPEDYARPSRRALYDFESPISPSRPHAGYVWDVALDAHVSFRDYGEFVDLKGSDTPWSAPAGFSAHVDPRFPGYNPLISDLTREAEWEREFRAYEREPAGPPALEIVRFPNDHTQGTRPGRLTPQAYVAQNDAAVGKLVEVVSHSRFWASSAIFVIEDDAQDGPDHVDEHRTTFLLASPFARGGVQHAMYTTAAVLRTIEIILGLPPMTTYDARALPLYAAFQAKADLRPFDAIAPKIDLNAKNAQTAYRARAAERLDLDEADAADAATMNDMLWHAVKGPHATVPPYGSFR